MAGIKEVKDLLRSMKPKLIERELVFCTVSEGDFSKLKIKPVLVFREKEGVTIIVDKKTADKTSLSYNGVWALVTFTVHSDLTAVGFLAPILKKLAENNISVNVVSAYYHDHLFIPNEKAEKTMKILNRLSKQ